MRLEEVPRFPCSRITKAPLVAGGFKAATTDPKKIEAWQAQFPRALWGVPCGELFDVLDLDGAAGLNWLRDNELPETRLQFTPRGRHYYFQAARELRPSVGKIARGVDVRSRGSYVIAWATCGLRTIERELAPWPQWILDQVLAGAGSPSRFTPSREVEGLASVSFSPNERDGRECTLLREPAPSDGTLQREHFPPSKTVNLRLRTSYILRVVEQAEPGTRNARLFWATCRLSEIVAEGRLRPEVAVQLLISAATICGLVRDEGGIRSVLATIRSGMKRRGAA